MECKKFKKLKQVKIKVIILASTAKTVQQINRMHLNQIQLDFVQSQEKESPKRASIIHLYGRLVKTYHTCSS